jgi:hypothetical protein
VEVEVPEVASEHEEEEEEYSDILDHCLVAFEVDQVDKIVIHLMEVLVVVVDELVAHQVVKYMAVVAVVAVVVVA